AVVTAVAARLTRLFAKVAEQLPAPAGGTFRVMHHLVQLVAGDLPLPRIRLLINEIRLLHDIAGAEEQDALARQAVAAGPPGFLVITLDILRQIVMNHEPDIRLIDAHAERNRGADHTHFVPQEKFLML